MNLKMYIKFVFVYLQTKMEYKFSFLTELIANIFYVGGMFIGIWLIFNKFTNIAGWNYYEIVFLYSLNLITAGASGIFFWFPMLNIGEYIRSGDFDRYLIRPMNPLLHLILTNFQYTFIPWIILGAIVFSTAVRNLAITWTFFDIIWFVPVLFGGILIHCAILLIIGTLSFWIIQNTELIWMIHSRAEDSIRAFVDLPINIYHKIIQFLLTFIIPYAFVNFYPSLHFFPEKNISLFSPYLIYGTPVVGILFFSGAYLLWNFGLKNYNSTGS